MDNQFCIRLRFCVVRLRSRWAACALIAVLSGWVPGARAGILTIDDFTQPGPATPFILGLGSNPSQVISQPTGGAQGGERDTLISVVGQGEPTSAVGLVGADTDTHVDALQVGTNGLVPTVVTLQYSGSKKLNTLSTASSLVNAHALGGGLGIDLTNGGHNDRFVIQFLGSDASPTAGLDVFITITSPGGKSSTSVMETVGNSESTFNFYIPFTDLHGNASPSQADSITYAFNSARQTLNVDYVVQLLGTASVPEPASGTLMVVGAGGLGLAAYSARRRNKKRLRAEST